MDVIDQKVLQTVFDLLSNHYPERHVLPAGAATQHALRDIEACNHRRDMHMRRLGFLWMYEAPGIFHALFRLVSPFIDHHTKAKIKFVYGQDAIKEFQQQIPDDVRRWLPF